MEREPIMNEPYSMLNYGGEEILLGPTTDRVDLWRGYGFAVLKALNEEGDFEALPMEANDGTAIAMESGLPLVLRGYITPEENELRLGYLASKIETWLDLE